MFHECFKGLRGLDWRVGQLSPPDSDLLDLVRRGDKDAFSALFLRHYDTVYRFLLKLTDSPHEAEDLAQEVFIKLYRHPLDANRPHNLRAWLYRVALNQAYNASRSRRREDARRGKVARMAEVERREEHDPADAVVDSERRGRVRQVLRSLPPRQQQCLILRYEGFSYAEIAAALEVAPSSVGTLLARAEAEFARRYEKLERGDVT